MEFASVVCGVSFRQKPWTLQQRVFDALDEHPQYLNIQLPTGSGKTFTAAGCYSIKQHRGEVNRLLVIFPSDPQLRQFERDSESEENADLFLAGVEGPQKVVDIRFIGAQAIQQHRRNEAQVFAITVQALTQSRGYNTVRSLMETGRWMIVVDEYHHYGLDCAWGKIVRSLPSIFVLAMSATPRRIQNDSAFGLPHITVSYRDALKEGAVKPLRAHSYNYRIQTVTPDGSLRTFTTTELIQEAGDDSPEAMERLLIQRRMRWSPKYVSPLVSHPIERMLRARISTGHSCLQVLIGAMCVSHAEIVCEQVRAMFPELRVEWVGTGPNGRSDAENEAKLKEFCPPKDEFGRRTPTLDVLVHVGMAGEGMNTVYVVEIVHLNRANRNNSNDQENGRAARPLKDANGLLIEGNINIDATSDYARFTGDRIMDAMDGLDEPSTEVIEDEDQPAEMREFAPLPEEPLIVIYNMELEHIDSGHPGVQRMATVLADQVSEFSRDDLREDSPRYDELLTTAIRVYRDMRRKEAEAQNTRAVIMQWSSVVESALNAVTHRILRLETKGNRPAEGQRERAGQIKLLINVRKKKALGPVSRDVQVCKLHYQWLQKLDQAIIASGIPSWLSSSIPVR